MSEREKIQQEINGIIRAIVDGAEPYVMDEKYTRWGAVEKALNRLCDSLLHRLTQAEAENQRLKKRVRELEKFCAGITNDWEWDDEPSGKAG